MDTSTMDFLLWVRGPGFTLAVTIFVLGMTWRIIEVLSLGQPRDLAEARHKNGSGWHTIASRSVPNASIFKRDPFTYVAGYIFHIGFFITLLFFAPHIELFRKAVGIGWPSLPTVFVDATAVITIITLIVIAIVRWVLPVRRLLTTFDDWLAWAATLLPILTGYIAFHHFFMDYQFWLAVHILSAEFLLVVFPFTKLTHAFTLFLSRWYTGERFAKRGVKA